MKVTPTIEVDQSAKADLLVPDPPNIARGVEIIQNATNIATTGNYTESNRENCS